MIHHLLMTSALAVLMTMPSPGALAAGTAEPFVLEGYDPAGGRRLITTGRYEEVIAQGARRLASVRIDIETATNLCVAYIKTGRFDTARTACDAAIAAAQVRRLPEDSRWPRSEQERREEMARSYSNRAVLNWYSGARAGAEADLATAAAYVPRAHFVLRNALALRVRGSSDPAITAIAAR